METFNRHGFNRQGSRGHKINAISCFKNVISFKICIFSETKSVGQTQYKKNVCIENGICVVGMKILWNGTLGVKLHNVYSINYF